MRRQLNFLLLILIMLVPFTNEEQFKIATILISSFIWAINA